MGLRRLPTIATWLLLSVAPPACKRDAPRESAAAPLPDNGVALSPDQMAHVEVTSAALDTQGAVLRTTGRVTYDEDHVARLAAPVSGRIVKLQARPGDPVKAGQQLATIHSPDVAAAAADLAQDRAQRVLAEQSLSRSMRLLERGAGTEREVDEAKAQLSQARAAEERDQAKLRVLGGVSESNPSYELKSPIDGTVTERSAALGAGVRVDDPAPVFVVADLQYLWILVDVFEQDIGLVQTGAQVDVTVPAYPDRVFVGEVEHVGDTLDPSTRTVKVRIQMSNPDRALKPEMFARISIRAPQKQAVRVPSSAILTKGEKTFVFVEDTARHFVPRQITVGSRLDTTVQILQGVAAGERVVARGGLLLDAEMQQRL